MFSPKLDKIFILKCGFLIFLDILKIQNFQSYLARPWSFERVIQNKRLFAAFHRIDLNSLNMYEFMVLNDRYIKKSLGFLEYKSIGGFLIEKESQISLLITYCIAILFFILYEHYIKNQGKV